MKPKPKLQPTRNPLAIALDEWLASDEGQKCLEPSILSTAAMRQYLENRIRTAFLAGVKAQEELHD